MPLPLALRDIGYGVGHYASDRSADPGLERGGSRGVEHPREAGGYRREDVDAALSIAALARPLFR